MPYSGDINSFYGDFGNGYVPFFAVIGAYNILMYGDNDVTPATNMVPDAIESFNHMGIFPPIADREINFWGFDHIDTTDMFSSPSGGPVTVFISNNTNPDVATATTVDNVVTVIAGSQYGSTEITVTGDDGSDETFDDVFKITALNPNLLTYDYILEDSPEQGLYPNNQNPYSNSYTDLNWTSINVTETDQIFNVHLSVLWESVDYPNEGTFQVSSPSGTDVPLYESTNTTPVQLEIDASEFNNEPMNGNWIIYMVDSYGDGGHRITNGVATFQVVTSQIGQVAGIVTVNGNPVSGAVISVSNIETISDDQGDFSFDILSDSYTFTCEVEGYDSITIDKNVVTDELTNLDFHFGEIDAPTNVILTKNSLGISLTWPAVTGANSYNIYSYSDPFSDPQTWNLEEEGISGTIWTDSTVDEKKFYYVVSSTDVP